MIIYTKEEYENKKEGIIAKVRRGDIFIYPTDTIYGIGCNALDAKAVEKIRKIKGNFTRPFSIMVPDKEWVQQHCEMISTEEEHLEKLPGPYTIILKMINEPIPKAVTDTGSVGVRIPDHWCTEIARLAKVPIITTSANRTGGNFMTKYANLDPEVEKEVDFMIDDGEVRGRPSTIIDVMKNDIKVR